MSFTAEDRNRIDPDAWTKIATSNNIDALSTPSILFPLSCSSTSLIVALCLLSRNVLWFVVSIAVAFASIIAASDTSDAMQKHTFVYINVCLLFIIPKAFGIDTESYTYIPIYHHSTSLPGPPMPPGVAMRSAATQQGDNTALSRVESPRGSLWCQNDM